MEKGRASDGERTRIHGKRTNTKGDVAALAECVLDARWDRKLAVCSIHGRTYFARSAKFLSRELLSPLSWRNANMCA